MESLARLLMPLALAHPGHGAELPWCDPGPELACPLPDTVNRGSSELQLARLLLDRGLAAEAALRLAIHAEADAEAALLLAEALERLGDARGAAIARERARRLADR